VVERLACLGIEQLERGSPASRIGRGHRVGPRIHLAEAEGIAVEGNSAS
jgi:hypothetical protein